MMVLTGVLIFIEGCSNTSKWIKQDYRLPLSNHHYLSSSLCHPAVVLPDAAPPPTVSPHIRNASQCVLSFKTHCDPAGRPGSHNGIAFPECPARDEQRSKKICPWQTVNSCLTGADFLRPVSALASEHSEMRFRYGSRVFRLTPLRLSVSNHFDGGGADAVVFDFVYGDLEGA